MTSLARACRRVFSAVPLCDCPCAPRSCADARLSDVRPLSNSIATVPQNRKRRQIRSVPMPQCGNPDPARALSSVAGILFAAIWPENLGTAAFRGVSSLVRSNGFAAYGAVSQSMTCLGSVTRAAGQRSRHRNQHSRASRQSALERLSHPRRAGARHHLDSGRAGGHAGRRLVGRAEGKSDAAILQFRRRALPTAPISPAPCSARSASAGSPTGSGARNCSSSRWRSISPRPPRPRCPGVSRATRCFDFSPAPASAANTPRSIRRSRNWCRRAIAAGPIS